MFNRSAYSRPYAAAYRSSPRRDSPLRNKTGLGDSPTRYSPQTFSPDHRLSEYSQGHMRLAQERLRDQEYQHERTLTQLRGQVAALRHQIDMLNQEHQTEARRIREEHEARMRSIKAEKEQELAALQRRLDETMYSVQRANDDADKEREEIELQCRRLNDENAQLRSQVSAVASELEYMKTQVYEKTKSQIESLEREKQGLSDQHQARMRAMDSEQRTIVDSLHETISNKEGIIRKLEAELHGLRSELTQKNELADRDIYNLEQTLVSTKHMLDNQRDEHERLKATRDEAKHENRVLASEANMLQLEVSKTRRENEHLKDEIGRLEKLVYGRNIHK